MISGCVGKFGRGAIGHNDVFKIDVSCNVLIRIDQRDRRSGASGVSPSDNAIIIVEHIVAA
jgi:ribosomal protein L14